MSGGSVEAEGRRRPRLLLIRRDRYPPYRVDLIELFGRWLAARYDMDWIMRRDDGGPALTREEPQGQRFRVSRKGALHWIMLQLREAVSAARGEPDLVQVRDAALSAALFLVAARIGGRPFTYYMSYPMAEGYLQRGLYQTPATKPLLRLGRILYGVLATRLLYGWLLPQASHVFVTSDRMKADVVARGVSPERITAVPMGVSIATYNPQAVAPSDDPRLIGRIVLVYVGAIDPERRIDQLAEALAQVVSGGHDAVLTIVGTAEGPDRRRIEDAAATGGVSERLIFTGHLTLTEALAYVRRADLCLAPFPTWPKTYLSATPTKLVEYLAMGRPVVATDHPDQRQVIEESGAGVIVAPTAEGFAAAIADLLSDRERAEGMGAKGPPWVAAHRDYAVISRKVAAVYDALLVRGAA